MTEPEEPNPPFPLDAAQVAKLRPIRQWPHDGLPRLFIVAWRDGDAWLGMWAQNDDAGVISADPVIHRTRALPATPSHFVDDRGSGSGKLSGR